MGIREKGRRVSVYIYGLFFLPERGSTGEGQREGGRESLSRLHAPRCSPT